MASTAAATAATTAPAPIQATVGCFPCDPGTKDDAGALWGVTVTPFVGDTDVVARGLVPLVR